jgi:hypothetical protein
MTGSLDTGSPMLHVAQIRFPVMTWLAAVTTLFCAGFGPGIAAQAQTLAAPIPRPPRRTAA